MAIFNISNNKVVYYSGAKCGSTTILAYANFINNAELLSDFTEMTLNNVDAWTAYHRCLKVQRQKHNKNEFVQRINLTDVPPDAIKFCVVRDPIERFISVYKAVILTGYYVKGDDNSIDEFIRIIDLDKKTLNNWHEVGGNGWNTVRFHFLPQTKFYGRNPNIFTHVFNIREIGKIKNLLEENYQISLPDIKLNTTKNVDINLTQHQTEWIKNRYSQDYKIYGKWM